MRRRPRCGHPSPPQLHRRCPVRHTPTPAVRRSTSPRTLPKFSPPAAGQAPSPPQLHRRCPVHTPAPVGHTPTPAVRRSTSPRTPPKFSCGGPDPTAKQPAPISQCARAPQQHAARNFLRLRRASSVRPSPQHHQPNALWLSGAVRRVVVLGGQCAGVPGSVWPVREVNMCGTSSAQKRGHVDLRRPPLLV